MCLSTEGAASTTSFKKCLNCKKRKEEKKREKKRKKGKKIKKKLKGLQKILGRKWKRAEQGAKSNKWRSNEVKW